MITIIICTILGLILFSIFKGKYWKYMYNENDSHFHHNRNEIDYTKLIGKPILSLICGAIVGFLISCMLPADMERVNVKEYEIVSLQDGRSYKENFFLLSGSVNGKMEYMLYCRNSKDGSIEYKSFNAKYVKLFYSDKPRLIKWRMEMSDTDWNKYYAYDGVGNDHFEIHIPKGSILEEHKLDLE